jgi:hypothetical protein
MLQHGAAKVIAVDTGYGQMDFGLRNDPRIRLLEKTNARYLEPSDIGEPVDFIAMDVSFISATLVLPAVIRAAFFRLAWRRPSSTARVRSSPDCGAGETAVRSGQGTGGQRRNCARRIGTASGRGQGRSGAFRTRMRAQNGSSLPSSAARAIANFCCTRSFRRLAIQ